MLAVCVASARWSVTRSGVWGVLGSRRPNIYQTWFMRFYKKQLVTAGAFWWWRFIGPGYRALCSSGGASANQGLQVGDEYSHEDLRLQKGVTPNLEYNTTRGGSFQLAP